ncbi:unnamed protein product, partial [Chrysoparadoxa australica]
MSAQAVDQSSPPPSPFQTYVKKPRSPFGGYREAAGGAVDWSTEEIGLAQARLNESLLDRTPMAASSFSTSVRLVAGLRPRVVRLLGYVNNEAVAELELENPSGSVRIAQLEVQEGGPFHLTNHHLSVEAMSSTVTRLLYQPNISGTHRATLRITWSEVAQGSDDAKSMELTLEGTSLQPPCIATEAEVQWNASVPTKTFSVQNIQVLHSEGLYIFLVFTLRASGMCLINYFGLDPRKLAWLPFLDIEPCLKGYSCSIEIQLRASQYGSSRDVDCFDLLGAQAFDLEPLQKELVAIRFRPTSLDTSERCQALVELRVRPGDCVAGLEELNCAPPPARVYHVPLKAQNQLAVRQHERGVKRDLGMGGSKPCFNKTTTQLFEVRKGKEAVRRTRAWEGQTSGVFFAGSEMLFESAPCGTMKMMKVKLCNACSKEVHLVVNDPDPPFIVLHHNLSLRARSYVSLPVRYCAVRRGAFE